MELALNIAWLTVVGVLFAAFGVWAAKRPDRAPSRSTVALALLCIAVLLFPVISMSDDLATAPAAVEAWNAMRRAPRIAHVVVHTFVTLVPIGPIHFARLACAGLIAIAVLSVVSPSIATVWSFRGPPSARA